MMYRIRIFSLFLFCVGSTLLFADALPSNSHFVTRCAKISNMQEFPDIVIVACNTNTGTTIVDHYVVKPDSCLRKGYKFGSFYLVWVGKSYFDATGLDNLPLQSAITVVSPKRKADELLPPDMGLLTIGGNFFSGYVNDSVDVYKEDLAYTLVAGWSDYSINLSSRSTTDINGTVKTETFTVPVIRQLKTIGNNGAARLSFHLGRAYALFSVSTAGTYEGSLLDCRGRSLMQFTRTCNPEATYSIPKKSLPAGMYWLRVQSAGTQSLHRVMFTD